MHAMLGVNALRVKALTPNFVRHHWRMPKRATERTAFHDNLKSMTDGAASVNAWSKAHKLEQTTIQRLVDGADPKLSMLHRIAESTGLEAWHLLIPGLDPKNPPVLRGASESEQALWARIEVLLSDLGKMRESASTRPGSL